MATKTIDILLNMHPDQASLNKAKTGIKGIEKSLKDVETQANRTREKMQKLVQVGMKIGATGALIIAPFALAVNKYLEAQKAVEAGGGKMEKNAVALVELQKEWAAAQVEVGRVATEILLPYLTQAVDLVKQIAAFAKEHPGAVKAALGIGASMVAIGGALSVVGSIVSTLATIQGLAAAAGIGGGAAAGGGGTAIVAAIAGIAPAVGAAFLAVMTSPLTWAIAALALTVPIMNWLLGTNQTWEDIGRTGHQALIIIGSGIDKLIRNIGSFFSNLGTAIWNALTKAATYIVDGVGGAVARLLGFVPVKDSGGEIGQGLFRNAGGREFVMSNSTTRAAENMIGGQLTQQRLLQGLGGNKRISYYDNRRIDSSLSPSDRRVIAKDTLSILSGVI